MLFRNDTKVALLLSVVAIFASCAFLKYPRDGIYLIPKNYVGYVIIVFDQPGGTELETEGGLFVYRIPEDGVLRVKNKGYAGMVNLSYFYVDAEGHRAKIEALRITGDRSPQGLPQNKFGNISESDYENHVYIMDAGGLGSFNTRRGIVQFTNFIVSTPKQVDENRVYDKMQERISDIQLELTSKAATS